MKSKRQTIEISSSQILICFFGFFSLEDRIWSFFRFSDPVNICTDPELWPTTFYIINIDTMVLILDGNSGAQVKSNLCYLTCLRRFIRSRAVTNRIIFFSPKIPIFLHACASCYDLPSNINTMNTIFSLDIIIQSTANEMASKSIFSPKKKTYFPSCVRSMF